jgi:hypothetical protein
MGSAGWWNSGEAWQKGRLILDLDPSTNIQGLALSEPHFFICKMVTELSTGLWFQQMLAMPIKPQGAE